MAKMSKGQYELLIEALGESLGQARRYGTAAEHTVIMAIRTLQAHLARDNRNFRPDEFMERIKAQAELDKLVDEAKVHDEDEL